MTRQLPVLLVITLISFGSLVAGARRGPRVERKAAVTGEETIAVPSDRGPYPSSYNLGPGDSIAFTTYDFGTNGSALRNLVNFGDGSLALGRMMAHDLSPSTTDRGSYFSYSSDNGSTWPEAVKAELIRTGWASIDQIPEAGGVEVMVSHDFGALNLQFNVDAARGSGIWSSSSAGGSVWPRIAVSSPFTFNVVASFNGNPPTEIVYLRSQDAGASFDIVDEQIFVASPGVAPDADGQDIAAQGTNVAIVAAGAGGDVGLRTSTDGGETWSEQVIYDVAGLGELPQGEEQFQPDGSCSVLFDPAGNIHVAWGNYLAIGDASNNPVLYLSVDVPMMYWSEATGIVNIAYPLPDTTIGVPAGRDGNFISQPDIGIDMNNKIHLIYSSMVDDQDTSGNYYEHVFYTFSDDGGPTWSTPVDITSGTGFDASFPSLADLVDENLHIVYNCDPLAGNSVQMNHVQIPVAVMYLQIPAFTTDVGSPKAEVPGAYALRQNYPNPFNPTTTVSFSLPRASLVTLAVYDLLGRKVATLIDERREAGTYDVTWNASGQPSGVYFSRMEADGFVATRKLVLLK